MLQSLESNFSPRQKNIRLTTAEQKSRPNAFKLKYNQIYDGMELDTGYEVALACGPLHKPRFVNDKIEQELVEFK